MLKIIISSEKNIPNEIEKIETLFDLGMSIFHLRKPNFSKQETLGFLEKISKKIIKKLSCTNILIY